jgi:hypothetical protein
VHSSGLEVFIEKEGEGRVIFVGIDWSERHHDVCVLDDGGKQLAKARVPEGIEGVVKLHETSAITPKSRKR